MIITKNRFVWKVVTNEARKLWKARIFPLYIIYSDDTEFMIEDQTTLELALEGNLTIGIEVGKINNHLIK